MKVVLTLNKIKNSFPVKIKYSKYKKHFVIRLAFYKDPLWLSIIIGAIIGSLFMIQPFDFKKKTNAKFTHNETGILTQQIAQDSIPREIFLPIFELSMPIKEATVTADKWQIFDNEVSWLKNSGDLSGGNIVLYAHNTKNTFGRITQLEIGRLIFLSSKTKQKKYHVIETFEASPTDVHLIQNREEDLLTMYTCSGWFDTKRFFVIAKPVN